MTYRYSGRNGQNVNENAQNRQKYYHYIQRTFSAARNGEILATEAEVNVVAGVVKQFFRELPKPLFPVEMYNDFVELLDSQGKERESVYGDVSLSQSVVCIFSTSLESV